MGNNQKYFVDAEVNDDEAYKQAISFATNLTNKNIKLKTILLVGHTKENTGWLERIYGENKVKALHKGLRLNNNTNIKIESHNVLKKRMSYQNTIFITMALDDKQVFDIDERSFDGVIIAIPWLKKNLKTWLTANNPIDIRSGKKYLKTKVELPCIVIRALTGLTACINMGTGLSHPSDEELAKTYARTLYRYVNPLEGDKILSYLSGKLNWRHNVAKEFILYIKKLQNGQSFRGGKKDEKTLNHYFTTWSEDCK
jgi:hypothetical protein